MSEMTEATANVSTETVTLEELFGKPVTQIKSGAELCLCAYLNYYLKALCNVELDITKCRIDKRIAKSEYFGFAVSYGLKVGEDYVYPPLTAKEYAAVAPSNPKGEHFFKEDVRVLKPNTMEQNGNVYNYIYDFTEVTNENRCIGTPCANTGYVSLLAYFTVLTYKSKKSGNKAVFKVTIDSRRGQYAPYDMVNIEILKQKGNQLITDDMIALLYTTTGKDVQMDFIVDTVFNKQLGLMVREYTPTEKYRVAMKLLKRGDAVLIYKKADDKATMASAITVCHPAVIQDINERGITLLELLDVRTRLSKKKFVLDHIARYGGKTANDTIDEDDETDTEDLEIDMEYGVDKTKNKNKKKKAEKSEYSPWTQRTRAVYGIEDCKIRMTTYSINWSDIGVLQCRYTENKFILKVPENDEDKDGAKLWLGGDGMPEACLFLPTRDVMYAVLEDNQITWNKEAFVAKYFTDRLPIYEAYKLKYGKPASDNA